MFAGSAGAVTTFTEDFETAGPFGVALAVLSALIPLGKIFPLTHTAM